jgi:hypothetical protein
MDTAAMNATGMATTITTVTTAHELLRFLIFYAIIEQTKEIGDRLC